ncbi:MAG: type II toxin-antitoxin system Phd/YefM family antitoxin [Anaerolineae bacterium]
MKRKHAMRIVGARQAKNSFGEVLRRVYEDDEMQIIERSGMPVAAIISMTDLERLYPERVKELPKGESGAKNQRAWRNLRAVLAEMQDSGEKFSEEEVDADVQQAVQEVRHGRSSRK